MRISSQVPSSRLQPRAPLQAPQKAQINPKSSHSERWRFEPINHNPKGQKAVSLYESHMSEFLFMEESPLGAIDLYA